MEFVIRILALSRWPVTIAAICWMLANTLRYWIARRSSLTDGHECLSTANAGKDTSATPESSRPLDSSVVNLRDHIERHRIVFHYLANENGMFWQRSNFFLVANAGLFAFVATIFSRSDEVTLAVALPIIIVICAAALGLSYFWVQGLRAGQFWIYHWHKILKDELEQPAFGEITLLNFEPTDDYPPRVRATPLAYGPVILFIVLWFVALIYSTWTLLRPAA